MDSVGDGVFWRDDKVEMDVVVSYVLGDDSESLPFADEPKYPFELLFTVGVGKDFAPVAGYPYDVVLAHVGGMFQPIEFGQHKIISFP